MEKKKNLVTSSDLPVSLHSSSFWEVTSTTLTAERALQKVSDHHRVVEAGLAEGDQVKVW